MKKDFISGSVFEFKVPNLFKYGYCKVLDFREQSSFDGIIVKVYDSIKDTPIKTINELAKNDLLFGGRRLVSLPGTRGKGAWKFLGVLISKDDSKIDDVKYCIRNSPLIADLSKIEPWDFIRDFNQAFASTYDNVKHLEDRVLTSKLGIEIRTAMEHLRRNQINIERYFDLSNDINKIIYNQMINVPIYNEIPKELRGHAKTMGNSFIS